MNSDAELLTYDAKQLLKTYKTEGILIFAAEADALQTEGSMASALQAQLDKADDGEKGLLGCRRVRQLEQRRGLYPR